MAAMFEAAADNRPAPLVAFIDDDDELRRANVQTLKLRGIDVQAHTSARGALPP